MTLGLRFLVGDTLVQIGWFKIQGFKSVTLWWVQIGDLWFKLVGSKFKGFKSVTLWWVKIGDFWFWVQIGKLVSC